MMNLLVFMNGIEWLKKITKNETNKKEILEFKKFVDRLSSTK